MKEQIDKKKSHHKERENRKLQEHHAKLKHDAKALRLQLEQV